MSRKRETRTAEIRATTVDGKPGVTLKAIQPGVVDDYGTVWMADVFDEALAKRGPVLCWSHDWSEPLGPMVGYRTGPDGPEIDFVFSDFDAVPQARRAHAQVSDGTIVDCSVGFARMEWREATDDDIKRWPGAREVITKSGLDEVSLVLRGAVPGAKVMSVRSGGLVDVDAVVEIARRKVAGELTDEEARAAVELLGADDAAEPPTAGGGEGGEPQPPADDTALAELEAEADELLASLERSARR